MHVSKLEERVRVRRLNGNRALEERHGLRALADDDVHPARHVPRFRHAWREARRAYEACKRRRDVARRVGALARSEARLGRAMAVASTRPTLSSAALVRGLGLRVAPRSSSTHT